MVPIPKCYFSRPDSPKHPKCLSPEAVALVQTVFMKYRYNTEEFVGQIAQGQTSNHNEAIHNILFSMVRKTDAVGLDLMRLGSALAVIRYNEGYRAITEILQKLQVTIHPGLIDLLTNLDQNRVEASGKLVDKQRRRFLTRLKRRRKSVVNLRKFGEGYSSGKFSYSHIEHPEDQVEDELLPSCSTFEAPVVPTSSQGDVEKCGICGGTEGDGTILQLNIVIDGDHLNWIQCDNCNKWYHCICVGLDEMENFDEEEWLCPNC